MNYEFMIVLALFAAFVEFCIANEEKVKILLSSKFAMFVLAWTNLIH